MDDKMRITNYITKGIQDLADKGVSETTIQINTSDWLKLCSMDFYMNPKDHIQIPYIAKSFDEKYQAVIGNVNVSFNDEVPVGEVKILSGK